MKQGMIHLYWGEGKGKTTAAMGLAVRARGSGMPVLVVQFLKDGASSELEPLRTLGKEQHVLFVSRHSWLYLASPARVVTIPFFAIISFSFHPEGFPRFVHFSILILFYGKGKPTLYIFSAFYRNTLAMQNCEGYNDVEKLRQRGTEPGCRGKLSDSEE